MAKFAVYKFITFFVFSYDILKEKPHLHFYKGKRLYHFGKIWLDTLEIEKRGDFNATELLIVQKLVKKYKKDLLSLYEREKHEKVETIRMNLK